jgi:superfamily II DNA helicase RecQ
VHLHTFRGKGNVKEKKAAFRQCFFRLKEVRSILPLASPMLALTATATLQVKKETVEGLALKTDTHFISISPNRKNIYLYKAKVNKSLDCFKWLIETVKLKKNMTPKTIVYCKSQKDCGRIFRHFKFNLKEHLYFPEGADKLSSNMVIGMYHANTLPRHKERVSKSLFDVNGTCRIVFASTALGMGVNIKDIFQVIHYGPPRQADDFLQEIGRAGRNGQPAKSILFYNGNHLRKCDKSIKDYARSSDRCLREIILQDFEETAANLSNKNTHHCCIICHKLCNCSGSSCDVNLPTFGLTKQEDVVIKQRRNVTKEQKKELFELLVDYQKELQGSCPAYMLSSDSTTGFSNCLIKSVLKKCKFIFSVDDVLEFCSIYKMSHAIDILHMIKDVFEDFEFDTNATS